MENGIVTLPVLFSDLFVNMYYKGIKGPRKRSSSIIDRIQMFDAMQFSNVADQTKPKRSHTVCVSNEVTQIKPDRSPKSRRTIHFTTQPISIADVLAAKRLIEDSGNENDIGGK